MIQRSAWLPADGMTLEPNALRAVMEEVQSLALTAGPGAGKTEVLAQRADFLLKTGLCRYPKRILAISFKVDASHNLKERVVRRCGPDLSSRLDSYTFHSFAKRIIDRFRPVLKGVDALDPGYRIGDARISKNQIQLADLVPLAVKILQKCAPARNAIRQTYSDVFLDEFQDCTGEQYELVKAAFVNSAIRLTAVGDTKQKIMGWAGALDGVFATFAADFVALPLNMYRNFRSKPNLLRVQNEIIRVLDPPSVMPDAQLAGDGGEVFAWQFKDAQEEAEHLADLIAGWVNVEEVPLSEVAVLVSKQLDLYAKPLMEALENRGIPYRNEQQLQDLTSEPVARLIIDYLSCLYGKREPKAWMRLVKQLVPFADDEHQADARRDLQKILKQEREKHAIAVMFDEPYSNWWESVRVFLRAVGKDTLAALSPDYESAHRLRELILDTKQRIEKLLAEEPDLENGLKRLSDDQAVRILTIHKSKGLEFHSVIMMAIEKEIFFGDADANRCAFFVGVSRAKQRLVLTHADQRARPDGFTKRWDVARRPQSEYLGYVTPFILAQEIQP